PLFNNPFHSPASLLAGSYNKQVARKVADKFRASRSLEQARHKALIAMADHSQISADFVGMGCDLNCRITYPGLCVDRKLTAEIIDCSLQSSIDGSFSLAEKVGRAVGSGNGNAAG